MDFDQLVFGRAAAQCAVVEHNDDVFETNPPFTLEIDAGFDTERMTHDDDVVVTSFHIGLFVHLGADASCRRTLRRQ